MRALCIVGTVAATGCASSPPRDSAVEGRDERVNADPNGPAGYEYVARRAHAMVAVAESRGLEKGEAAAAAEGIADRLEACAREPTIGPPGVVRVVARVANDGSVDGTNVTVEPARAATALRCVISPVKLLVFHPPPAANVAPPASEGGPTRGVAFEAEWRP